MSCRVAVLAFADATRDGRTLNICRTLAPYAHVVLWNLALPPADREWVWRTVAIPSHGRVLWRWALFVVRFLWQTRSERYKVVWAADVYCLLPAVILRWCTGARVVYDSRELYSSLASLAKRPIAQRLQSLYERVLVRWVHRVVVSGERDADELVRSLGLVIRPLVVMNVPFYAEPQRNNRLRQSCCTQSDEVILLYQGVLTAGRGLFRAVEAIALLPQMHLCILGDGSFGSAITEYAKRFGVANRVHLLGSVPYNELLQWTASADVGWCWIEPLSHSYQLALPNKLFEYAMARLPVIASDLPAIAEVLERFPFGECMSTTATAIELAATLERILAAAPQYRQWADRAARQYCYERQQPAIRQLVEELCRR
ncbi:MAG: glycosyltransferase [Chlorobi bacterium]|nr:glycosyltransferase [Chlorobiota bacterium]